MKKRISISIFLIILALSTVAFGETSIFKDGKVVGVNTIEELDSASVFSFAIMSDNKGESSKSREEFANMVNWIAESGDKFVIGLGDHVKKGWDNSFLPFIEDHKWWRENFYPNIADGENEYYGKSQADWGAGAPFLDVTDLRSKEDVEIRENSCEYYAKIHFREFTIHLIQLHFSDSPKDPEIAFNEDSRKYLIETLESIKKGKKDIIIAAAHSRKGFWVNILSDERQKIVMDKCDLVLSATTHFFERMVLDDYETDGPLIINTGSITYASSYCPNGYIQVHVLEKPLALVVQYYDASHDRREMRHSEYAYIKLVGREIFKTDFKKPRPEDNLDRIVGKLPKQYKTDAMQSVTESLFVAFTDADIAYVEIESGLDSGEIVYRDLWKVFPFNNEVFMLTLTDKEVKKIFEDKLPLNGLKEINLAINSWNASYIIGVLNLTDDKILKTGKTEIDVLEDWLSSFD